MYDKRQSAADRGGGKRRAVGAAAMHKAGEIPAFPRGSAGNRDMEIGSAAGRRLRRARGCPAVNGYQRQSFPGSSPGDPRVDRGPSISSKRRPRSNKSQQHFRRPPPCGGGAMNFVWLVRDFLPRAARSYHPNQTMLFWNMVRGPTLTLLNRPRPQDHTRSQKGISWLKTAKRRKTCQKQATKRPVARPVTPRRPPAP